MGLRMGDFEGDESGVSIMGHSSPAITNNCQTYEFNKFVSKFAYLNRIPSLSFTNLLIAAQNNTILPQSYVTPALNNGRLNPLEF